MMLESRVSELLARVLPIVIGVVVDLGSAISALVTVLLRLLLEIDPNCSNLLARMLRVWAAAFWMLDTSDSVMFSAKSKLTIAGAGIAVVWAVALAEAMVRPL